MTAPPHKLIPEPENDTPSGDLERGQLAKLDLIAKRARLTEGCRVLDVGCGWGSFAIHAARKYGAQVVGLTISENQKEVAEKRVEAAGLSHVVTILLVDYRAMPSSFHHSFDAVVAIGLLEHVGSEYMDGWFKILSWAMKPEDSVGVFVVTTVPDTHWEAYSKGSDFIQQYIFPGDKLSSVATLVNSCTKAGLNINSLENLGPHYTRTVREWRYRFQRNFESHIKPALQLEYPSLADADIEIFRRKWIYYFVYCEAGFATSFLADHVFTVTREGNLRLVHS
ncbi:hypothetical protein V5O48_008265 [Marasmius crinis-equi]|uniref:Cyclopropane-fatty-acyl-phospholipid synthase n=1 Tax=Marasmius crinis-equi TaxID=585013 RepID=A0ABR3FEG3_9AGAR